MNGWLELPISIKGIILFKGQVVLLKNERNEWELPGGRLEKGETPLECVAREIKEELDLDIRGGEITDTWVYEPIPEKFVFIVTYFFIIENEVSKINISEEHQEAQWFSIDKVKNLNIPAGYVESINKCVKNIKHFYEKNRLT